MPYFNNGIINILFIHINKIGGSSVTEYLSDKHNIELNNASLYGTFGNYKHREPTDEELELRLSINSRLQHITYTKMCKYSNIFNINYNDITIITVVRNPYDRIMSALFYLDKINVDSTPDNVFDILNSFLLTEPQDNFNMPQYLFITDKNGEIIPDLKILHTESLKNDMSELGYTDFDLHVNSNPHTVDYKLLLNDNSIRLINDYYNIDFDLFKYNKLPVLN